MIGDARNLPLAKQVPLRRRQQGPVLFQNRPVEAPNREADVLAVVPLPEEEAPAVAAEPALKVWRGRVELERRLGRELDGGLGELVGVEDERPGVFAALLALACC